MNTAQPLKSKREIKAIKNALHGRDRLFFILAINSGLRVSDLLRLKVGDVRGKTTITLREQKTGKAKQFRLNKAVKDAVKTLVPADASDDDYLFRSRKGGNRPISRVQVFRRLSEAATRAGLNRQLSPHSLRKTFGYFAYKQGVDISLLMSIFNHSSEKMTLRYIGIEQDDIDNVYETLNL